MFWILKRITHILTISFLQGCSYLNKEEAKDKVKHEISLKFGWDYNVKRRKFGIPEIPLKGWKAHYVIIDGLVGISTYGEDKFDPTMDTNARYSGKEIYFYTKELKPIREIDLYYSGKRYMDRDPDQYGWERLQIENDFLTDTLQKKDNHSNNSVLHTDLVKGRTKAYLYSPEFIPRSPLPQADTTDKDGMIMLKEVLLSLVQADSVLNSWGIKR